MVINTESDYLGYPYRVVHATIIIPVLPGLLLHYCSLFLNLLLKELGHISLILRVTIGAVRCNIPANMPYPYPYPYPMIVQQRLTGKFIISQALTVGQ